MGRGFSSCRPRPFFSSQALVARACLGDMFLCTRTTTQDLYSTSHVAPSVVHPDLYLDSVLGPGGQGVRGPQRRRRVLSLALDDLVLDLDLDLDLDLTGYHRHTVDAPRRSEIKATPSRYLVMPQHWLAGNAGEARFTYLAVSIFLHPDMVSRVG